MKKILVIDDEQGFANLLKLNLAQTGDYEVNVKTNGAEGLKALVIEDLTIGGQAGTSSRIENYMGFPTGISGADLVWRGEVQAMKFGTQFAVGLHAKFYP